MVEDNSLLVPKIPIGVSGTALAASLLRDGWSVSCTYFSCWHPAPLFHLVYANKYPHRLPLFPVKLAKMYAKYQEAVDALRHEQLGRKESEAILQRVWLT